MPGDDRVLAPEDGSPVERGRATLAKAFRQEGLDGSERTLEAALKPLKQASLDDLYVAVGNGNITAREVVSSAYPELRQAPRAPRMLPSIPQRGRGGAGAHLPITGLVPGMAISYAGCCHPLPGDPIVGIVTTGKGVTIHTRDCHTLENFSATPERFIDVDWDPTVPVDPKTDGHTGRISVVADNVPGSIANVTNAISRQDGDIVNLRIVNRQADFCELLVDVEVKDLRQLVNVIASLRAAPGVHQVERARG